MPIEGNVVAEKQPEIILTYGFMNQWERKHKGIERTSDILLNDSQGWLHPVFANQEQQTNKF